MALRTDWSKRWPDAERFYNRSADSVCRTVPAGRRTFWRYCSSSVASTAVGHEGIDTDPGLATSKGDYSLEHYILARDRWQIELLTNLDKVPEAGALIMATWPKAKDGSGFPARAVAIHR